ncbi:MAG TPA: pyridoxamine 5'-phosphate oxidase family protein [Polyangia bacterium]|nr:pyridoxamine 5'-phosphate oxidase family protein [Polyangia bacterium]
MQADGTAGEDDETMTTTGTDDLASQARALLQRQQQGVLSTISVHRAGYPYGSLTPYALSRAGAPLILISALAAHTQNLVADGRASLFIAASDEESGDPQAGTRISLLGRFARVPSEAEADARARYAARLPRAAANSQTPDFQIWEMTVEAVRLVAGFGKIGWLDGGEILVPASGQPT